MKFVNFHTKHPTGRYPRKMRQCIKHWFKTSFRYLQRHCIWYQKVLNEMEIPMFYRQIEKKGECCPCLVCVVIETFWFALISITFWNPNTREKTSTVIFLSKRSSFLFWVSSLAEMLLLLVGRWTDYCSMRFSYCTLPSSTKLQLLRLLVRAGFKVICTLPTPLTILTPNSYGLLLVKASLTIRSSKTGQWKCWNAHMLCRG